MSAEPASTPESTPTPPTHKPTEAGSPDAASFSQWNELLEETPQKALEPGTRECPFCGKILREDAVTCRYCKRDLYSADGARMVLPEGEWNTKIPQWMIDEESRLYQRWIFWKKVRKYQWHIVGGILACLGLVIVVRLLTAPPEPHKRSLIGAEPKPAPSVPTATPSARVATLPSPAASAIPSVSPTASPDTTPSPASTPSEPEGASVASTLGGGAVATPAPAESGEDDIVMDAKDLAAEFEQHRVFAEDKFNGRMIRVSGDVKTIDTSGNTAFILLRTDSHPPVKCLLSPAGKQELYRIKPGKSVTLRGTCDGAFLEILISDCVFVL